MFTEDEWRPVLESLVRLTMAGKVDWELVDEQAGTFETSIKDVTYSLGSVDGDGRQPFTFTVFENDIALDELVTDGRGGNHMPTTSFEDIRAALANHLNPLNAILVSLQGLARRSALGAEEKAASLLESLIALEDPEGAEADRLQSEAEWNAE
jgi:hypothetical protein